MQAGLYISLRAHLPPAQTRLSARRRFPPAMISDVPARGKFITFEGLDGSGKSTQVEKLARSLRAHGLSVIITREPGGTSAGEKIREVLLHSATSGLSPLTEMALMFASRAQHVHEVILPALAEGRETEGDKHALPGAERRRPADCRGKPDARHGGHRIRLPPEDR